MKILSLFDGMACGMLAMQDAGVAVDRYVAFEIDKYAVQTSSHNFPMIEHRGDVFEADFTEFCGFDFLIGGSPCTYWSIAQKNNRETEASGLGWELFSQYVRALHEVQPKYFIYENNKSMSKAIRESITKAFGFEPICINSALVSAQNRQRLYWVGKRNPDGTYSKVNVEQPEDRGILLRDVLDGMTDKDKGRCVLSSCCRTTTREYFDKHQGTMAYERVAEPFGETNGKAYALTASYWKGQPKERILEKSQRTHVAEPVNITKDGKSQTIKAQYQKTSPRNICCYTSTYGASGVAEPVVINTTADGDKARTLMAGYYKYGTATLITNKGFTGGTTAVAEPVPYEWDGDGKPTKAVSGADGKEYPVYEVKDGKITIKGKQYPIKLADGFYIIRKLTVSECKRLQTVPEWYEFPVSDTQAYKMLGNGWTVEVISHLIKAILRECHQKSDYEEGAK